MLMAVWLQADCCACTAGHGISAVELASRRKLDTSKGTALRCVLCCESNVFGPVRCSKQKLSCHVPGAGDWRHEADPFHELLKEAMTTAKAT